MITIKFKGGLGNQMFQYATGRAIAHMNNSWISFDLGQYNYSRTYQYPFTLDRFNVNNSHDPGIGIRMIKEKGHYFQPGVLTGYDSDIIIDGYWQSEEYFKFIKEKICSDFILHNKYIDNLQEIIHFIKEFECPVFVHIRRNERANEKHARSIYGLLPKSYYINGMEMIKNAHPNAKFLIVSDDKEWVYKYMTGHFDLFSHGHTDYETMHLMRMCKHAVIANSSFSWWGAWLIANKDKMVITPTPWTKNESYYSSDIYPKNWIKINGNYQ